LNQDFTFMPVGLIDPASVPVWVPAKYSHPHV